MLEFDIQAELEAFQLAAKGQIASVGVTALFGVSGSGKTSILRAIAGFLPVRGTIRFNGVTWADGTTHLVPQKRPVGFLFQDDYLFPHWDVAGNLAFAENASRPRRAAIANGNKCDLQIDKADCIVEPNLGDGATKSLDRHTIIEAFDLNGLMSRRVQALSGGERRRVAFARTLLTQPKLLLLDEPLTGLDTLRRLEIMPYIERLTRDFDLPILLVSHSLDEVSRLADSMLLVEQGRITEQGEAQHVLRNMAKRQPMLLDSLPASVLVGYAHAFDAVYQLVQIKLGQQSLWLPSSESVPQGTAMRVAIHDRDVIIAATKPDRISSRNVLRGQITAIEGTDVQPTATVHLSVEGQTLAATITRAALDDLDLRQNQIVYVVIKSTRCEPLARAGAS